MVAIIVEEKADVDAFKNFSEKDAGADPAREAQTKATEKTDDHKEKSSGKQSKSETHSESQTKAAPKKQTKGKGKTGGVDLSSELRPFLNSLY